MLRLLFFFFLSACMTSSSLRSSAVSPEVCLSADEKKLLDLINGYRKKKKLPPVEASSSLTYVAQSHAKDLAVNNPDTGSCNMHSWSDKGAWTACCYTPDHRQASCLWGKPAELTDYKGYGFEISARTSENHFSPEGALRTWQESSLHNQVIVNQGIWKKYSWKAIGIGMYENYATVWFGAEQDPAGKPGNCK